ncbi:MAG: beta strand repeat-containing protein, partial [Pyrinomonadaceae bacterium]
GDGNFDASQSATYAQDVLNCVTNPIVTTTADSGAGSLREAMMNVCAAPNNVITFNIDPGTGPHTIQLASVLPAIAASVDITNTSGESITVSGEGAADPYRIFKINSGQTVNISNLTITNGAPDGAAVFPANVGGGILNEGTLTLTGCTVSGNTVTSIGGGGIYNYLPGATLNLVNSTVSGNHATVTSAGGGIHNNGGNVSLTDSTVSGNDAAADGGGINNGTGTLTVTGSTVSGNTANFGGGIQNFGTLTLTNSTISSNNANTDGGGLYINATGATFTSVTFSNNRADNDSNATGTGGGMFVFAGTPTLNNTIVAGNFNENNPAADTADDIAGPGIVNATSSFNLIGTGGAGGLTTTGAPTHNQVGVASPGLGLLLNNGGPTFTHALLTGSPAIDKGDDFSLVPTTDQRGQTRPVDTPSVVDTSDGSDIGAFEKGFSPIPAVTTTAGNLSYAENDPATAIDPGLTVTDDDSANLVDASASITTNFQAGQDVLSWIDNNALDSITLNVGSSTAQTIVLTGTDTLANYEAALRAVTYQNTSDNPSTLTRTVTFTVNDDTYAGSGTRDIAVSASNDNPTITSNGSGPTASVNAVENQTAVTTVTSTDPDGGTPGYSIIGGADMGVFSIGSLSGVLTFNSAPNFEAPTDVGANNVYEVTVQVSDGNSGIDTQAISVTVTNVNEAPVITSDGGGPTANVNAEENQTAVTTVMSTDVDGGTPSYSISGGADMGAFSIGSSSGVLTFNSAPNFESPTDAGANNVYEVEVQVSDGNSGTDTQAISVTVTNVNEAPVNTVPTTQGTNLDTPLTFSSGSGNQISVTDVDAGSADIRITLTATNGTITLGSIPAGLSFGAGDGTADTTMTFDGTLTEVNTAMNGMSFNPTAGFSGAATLTITSNDLGNTGTGGAQSDGPDTVNIQVATNLKINDASVPEPASPNTTNMVFTVSLSAPAPGLVTVNFTTQDEPVGVGKAVAGQDYTSTNGTVTFTAGQQVKTIHVPILSDNTPEPDETFLVQLSGESGATLVDGTATGTIKAANTAGTLLISEFRQFGPGPGNDPLDDFVEIYNNTNAPITVPAGGYGLFRVASTCSVTDQPQLIGTIPAGTVIPARGHFLFTGPIANYSLKDYGGTNAAVNNALLTVDLGANENFGLFATADVSQISSVNRFDAVGFGINDQNACDLLREGTLLPALTVSPSLGQHSYFRKMCDWIQHQGCTVPGIPKDTNNNSDDFWLADTTASVITGRLGAPGPENLASPIRRDNANNPLPGGINVFLLDSTIGPAAGANRDRNSLEGAGSTPTQFGTMTLRYRVTNNTGAPVTRLRYRIVDISTHLQSGGPTADLRAITGTDHAAGPVHDTVTCTADGQPAPPPGCTVTVKATTLETPPAQAIGGGYNSTLSSGTITTLTPLPNGQSILINFKLGVQKTGAFRVFVTVEALP